MRGNRTPNTECSVCGKPLYRRPFEFREGKEFCCKGCRSELYKRKPEIWKVNLEKGHGWNKGLSLEAGDILLYGRPRSEKTKKNISDALTGREFSEQHRQHLRNAMVKRRGSERKTGTDIEKILWEWLTENNVDFEENKPIGGITNPDFFIQPNICLYADGDYWHSLEITKTRDVRIDRELMERGFRVIRLLGSEIKAGVRPVELLCEA